MGIIYSNVPPLRMEGSQYDITGYIEEKLEDANEIIVATGYASKKSILTLDQMVREKHISKTTLVLGMYCIEGFPESIYNTAMQINAAWQSEGIGQIRVTKSMKYHGKIYGFIADDVLNAAVIGSHNLGAIAADPNNLRQYELSLFTEDPSECAEVFQHLKAVSAPPVSVPIDSVTDVSVIHEENTKLNNVEGVTKVSTEDVAANKLAQTNIRFDIPLKVPGMPGVTQDFMKSNINKCYAKGRLNTRTGVVTERGWWETEIIVGTSITERSNYPDRDIPFYVITDDGWKFMMHCSGDHKKNLESNGDLKILGYWLKGRLVAAGIVEPVDSPAEDLKNIKQTSEDVYENCKGVITYQKLKRYGRTSVSLTKTLNKLADEDGTMRDVWVLSFLPKDVK